MRLTGDAADPCRRSLPPLLAPARRGCADHDVEPDAPRPRPSCATVYAQLSDQIDDETARVDNCRPWRLAVLALALVWGRRPSYRTKHP